MKKLGMTTGELRVREKVDTSGDWTHCTYDIMGCYPWGSNGVIYDIDNPNDARLFCGAPKMLEGHINNVRLIADAIAYIQHGFYDKAESVLLEISGNSDTCQQGSSGKTYAEIEKLV